MRVAVVGAGIVGACTVWALARKGVPCTLYDRHQPMGETSRASSKLLHGGLRYLETGQFRLVAKALQARRSWLEQAPHLCHRLELLLPLYRHKGRSRLPLLRSADNPSAATREWAFEQTGKVLHIYGGKWTTAQLQGEEAANRILQ